MSGTSLLQTNDRCLAYSPSNAPVVSGVNTVINYTKNIYDTVNSHDTQSNISRITIKNNFNLVRFVASISGVALAAGTYTISLLKNGLAMNDPNLNYSGYFSAANVYTVRTLDFWLLCSPNDYFEVSLNQATGLNFTISSSSFFAEFAQY